MGMQLITLCLTIAPIFLFIVSALGLFKIMSVGPAEFPKDHPVNTKLSYILMASALGMFYYRFTTNTISQVLGVVLSVGCIIAYSVIVAKHRREFPHKPTEEIYKETRLRFDQRRKERTVKSGRKNADNEQAERTEKTEIKENH